MLTIEQILHFDTKTIKCSPFSVAITKYLSLGNLEIRNNNNLEIRES
jgi:hypothetical protein